MPTCGRCGNQKNYEEFGNHPSLCLRCRNDDYFIKHAKPCCYCGKMILTNGNKFYCSNKCHILDNIEKTECGCWEWKRCLDKYGYGKATNYETRKQERIHRISYKVFIGPITKGMFVCHSCDNTKCCNPDHLWLGTCKDNMIDCSTKKRLFIQHGEKHWIAKLKDQDVIRIRDMLNNGESISSLCKMYNVSNETIRLIKAQKTWRHLL